ncbi:MAG TPA: patatin-like phospholipase family protein [Casimicrobiaceae bacterium]|nr:patatin-like phospholipase family protein [Casimicrobiaceae bacterium]
MPTKPKRDGPFGIKHQHSVLVLQGGGALGAYQAGVYQGMAEHGFAPDWVAGVSIGAVNAALIAGNPPQRRIERLREFWERVSSGLPLVVPAQLDLVRLASARLNATAVVAFGVPGFFVPRVPPPLLAPEGTPAALSIYDNAPLLDTLHELVDFGFLNRRSGVRLSLGAVNVETGNSVYFDSRDGALTPRHVLASGSLPPGFPPTVIEGSHYWDGGIVSNSPLWYVLDDAPRLSALIVQVDLFSARGALPANLDQVLERAKDIQYSSKTRFNTSRVAELEEFRQALARLFNKVPAKLRDDADFRRLRPLCSGRREITILHLINRRSPDSTSAKDYEFSRATMEQLWEAGLDDVRLSCSHKRWEEARSLEDGVRIFDLTA